MSSADLLEDGFPHGTPEGYDLGCHSGGGCPTGREYGLSCKTAKMKSRGDGHYTRLVKGGATIPEIADALGLIGTAPTTAPAAVRKPKPTPKPAAPAVDAEPAPETAEPVDAVAAPTHTTREIRAWAIQKGYDVRGRGTIRQEIIDHYRDAHGLVDPAAGDQPAAPEPAEPSTPVTPSTVSGAITIKDPVDVVSDVRPDWGTLNLENDLAAALAERDQARDLSARLWDELDRSDRTRADEQAAHAATRAASADALDEARTDITNLTTALSTARADRHALSEALAAASAALHTTERALELVLQKWDDATRATTDVVCGSCSDAIRRALDWYAAKGDWKTSDEQHVESILRGAKETNR